MLDEPIWENVGQVHDIALGRGGFIINVNEIRETARRFIASLSIRTDSPDLRVNSLSGGNQQKVVLAKWLAADPQLLLLDDPTRGVDVGAKAEMHVMIRQLAASRAVVLCSTDLIELANACDRVIVFFQGRVCAELSASALIADALLLAMNTGSASEVDSAAAVTP
jgi:ABC-type sugar transport system ATPase subunit